MDFFVTRYMLTLTTAIGFFAALASTAAIIPQTYNICRHNETENPSIVTFIIVMMAMSLWTTYGIIRLDWPLICSSVALFMVASYITYKIYSDKETPNEDIGEYV